MANQKPKMETQILYSLQKYKTTSLALFAKMKTKRMKKIFFPLVLLTIIKQLPAQNIPNIQASSSTAAQGTVGDFIISYTIGEMTLVTTQTNNGLTITQGILQPIKGIADTLYECFSQTEVRVYPNPNPGIFSLQLSIFKKGNVKLIFFDAAGKMLQQDAFDYNSFITKQYNIQKLANGQYYLQLFFTETGTSKAKKCTYTIQKIN
jgi:Secretion system C-terminal sorting domain